jgi:hypothetical protein
MLGLNMELSSGLQGRVVFTNGNFYNIGSDCTPSLGVEELIAL